MHNLLRRSTSGLIYVILFVSAILFSQESFIILTSIFAVFCIWEFSKLIAFKNIIPYVLFGALVFLIVKKPESKILFIVLILTLLCSTQLIYNLYSKRKKRYIKFIEKLDISIRYIVFSACFLLLIPFTKGEYNPYILINILILILVNDSFAFLVGKNFGKHKLFKSVSPKKTIEGFIGGFVFSLIAGCIIAINTEILSVPNWLIIAAITSVIGTIGDLVESKFKRLAHKKDSGNIMPGHGGLLDRLDSLLFAAPFVYLYIHYII